MTDPLREIELPDLDQDDNGGRLRSLVNAYFTDLRACPPLNREEERALLVRVRTGDPKAMARLVLANLRFVVSVAKRYQRINDVPLEELIAEGNLGLIRAAQRFSEGFNVRFISYAVWWVRQSMIQVLSRHAHPIQLPLNRVHQLMKIRRMEELLTKKLNRKPSLREMADALKIPAPRLYRFLQSVPQSTSLEGSVDGDEDLQLRDVLSDHGAADPCKRCERQALEDEIDRALRSLKPREELVIRHRYGLNNGRPHTLEEIGKLLNLSRERVRQIEAQALNRLRHPVRAHRLDGLRD